MTSESPFSTFQTRVPGLDEILGGGLWSGGLYLLEGLPGTGKTILANQIAFSRAAAGEKVLYVSLISESHGKMIHHLSHLGFFDERAVGSGVYYLSGYRSLVDRGLEGLFDFLLSETRERTFSCVVVEGFSSADYLKHNLLDLAEFMHRLNALAASLRCTVLLVSHDQGTDDHPEHTLVDGVIELSRVSRGMRTARYLKVHKIRGRDPVLGQHAFVIRDGGITVFPRLEAIFTRAAQSATPGSSSGARVAFGVPGLDAMLRGGLVPGGSTAILGTPGSGKTVLSAKFLETGLKQGRRALFFGFYESPARLLDKARSVGIDLGSGAASGALKFLWHPPLEYSLDELAWTLLQSIAEHRPERVVIDGIAGFAASSLEHERITMFLSALTNRLRTLGVNTLITEELSFAEYGPHTPPVLISPILENALMLRHVELRGGLFRYLSVVKVRESDYDTSVKEFRITAAGVEVNDPPERAIGNLDDRARG